MDLQAIMKDADWTMYEWRYDMKLLTLRLMLEIAMLREEVKRLKSLPKPDEK